MTLMPEDVPDTNARLGAPPSALARGIKDKLRSEHMKKRATVHCHLSETKRIYGKPFQRKHMHAA